MKNKFIYLIKTSFKRKVNTKSLKIFLLLLISVVFNLDIIINSLGGDFEEKLEIIVLDKTNETFDELNTNIITNYEFIDRDKVEITQKNITEEILSKEVIENDKVGIILELQEEQLIAKILSEEEINTIDYQLIVQSLNQTKSNYVIEKSNVDINIINDISTPISIEKEILSDDASVSEQMETVMGSIFPVLILPFFMLTIYLVQILGAEINEEKSTRSMEIVLTNVSAKSHFFAKIIAANAFIILQGILLVSYVAIAYFIRTQIDDSQILATATSLFGEVFITLKGSGVLEILYYIVPLTIILFILSFIAFSLVAGILASVTVNQEDYQQIQMPIMIILLIGYYLSIMAGLFDGSLLIRILSYVPFISAMLSPALLLLGQTTVMDVIISIIILVLFNIIVLTKGVKVYKMGVLNYSSGKLWQKLFNTIKSNE